MEIISVAGSSRRWRRWSLGGWSYLICGVLTIALAVTVVQPPLLVPRSSVPSAPSSEISVAGRYGQLPLSFELNLGQADPAVRFLVRGEDYALALTGTEMLLVERPSSVGADAEQGVEAGAIGQSLRVTLVDANPEAELSGVEPLPGVVNYFLGNDPALWRTGIATYGQVRAREVWPGVDVVYYGNQGQLEIDLVVAAGADVDAIALRVTGDDPAEIDETGDLTLGDGGIRLSRPVVYQEVDSGRRLIEGRYVLGEDGLVRFQVGEYDETVALVIDPVLVYSTYLGGNSDDRGIDIAVDGDGNAYIIGTTQSTDFPVQPAGSSSLRGSQCAFVTKLNAAGTALVYSTYLGGSWAYEWWADTTSGSGIAVDTAGAAYVTGSTYVQDFPMVSAMYPYKVGHGVEVSSAFVTKLNPAGVIEYSTYLGGVQNNIGVGDTFAEAIAVDSNGSFYVTGTTKDQYFPTSSPLQPACAGEADGFVTKFNASGSVLLFSTYLGGTGYDGPRDIALDAASNVYVAGMTRSTNFPTTATALQPAYGGGNFDAFVAKLASSGSFLVYSTYLGGSEADEGSALAVGSDDSACVVGYTYSSNFPMPANPDGALYRNLQGPNSSAFLARVSVGGSALLYATYLGGAGGFSSAYGVSLDPSGVAWISGRTNASDFPTTSDAHLPMASGTLSFVSGLNMVQNRLDYSTFFTGGGRQIAVDSQGGVYVTGYADSAAFEATNGAFDVTYGGGTCLDKPCKDAVVFKFGRVSPVTPAATATATSTSDAAATHTATMTPTASPTVTGTPTRTRTPTVTPTLRLPIVESIDPNSAGQGINVDVTIYGYFFQPGASVTIGQSTLRQIEYLGAEKAMPHRWRLKGTLLGGLPVGSYAVNVVNPDGQAGVLNDGFTVRDDFERGVGAATVSYGAYTWTGVGSHNYPVQVACGGAASITVEEVVYGDPPASVVLMNDAGQTLAAMTRANEVAGGGLYRGMVNLGTEGIWTLTISKVVSWADGQTITEKVFGLRSVCVDPSGRIYDATTTQPIAGALVTLMSKEANGDVIWNAISTGQANPQTSNQVGRYGWNTPAGRFFVRVSKPCYGDAQSPVVNVPPAVTDLEIGLTPRECSPLRLRLAQVTGADGTPIDLVPAGSTVSVLAKMTNTGTEDVAADYRIKLLDAQGRATAGMSRNEAMTLPPGVSTVEFAGTLPQRASGEYTLMVWVVQDQQTIFRAYKFRVGIETAQMHTYLPFAQR